MGPKQIGSLRCIRWNMIDTSPDEIRNGHQLELQERSASVYRPMLLARADEVIGRWHPGCHCAPLGLVAVGAARPTARHREPCGCRQQYRGRGGLTLSFRMRIRGNASRLWLIRKNKWNEGALGG